MQDDAAPQLYIADPNCVRAASDLIARHGDAAGEAAANRAQDGRRQGNVLGFCRWRQIERLVALLASERPCGTIH